LSTPANRLAALARYGLAAKAPALRDLAEPRKTATLLATVRHLEAAAVDDALDLFGVLMAARLISTARRASAAERLAAMLRLERASVTAANRPVICAEKISGMPGNMAFQSLTQDLRYADHALKRGSAARERLGMRPGSPGEGGL
jgi:hypothetical protein